MTRSSIVTHLYIYKTAMRTLKSLILALTAMTCFAMSAEEKFALTCQPYLQNLTDSTVTVVYATNRPSVAWVEITPDDHSHFYAKERPKFFDSEFGHKNTGEIHRVTVRGLRPDTKYRYRIYAREVFDNGERKVRYGDVVASRVYGAEPYEFKTSGAAKDQIHFAVLNDIHEDTERYVDLFHQIDSSTIDFMVLNGDMTNNMDRMSQLYDGYLNKTSELFARSIPFYMVRGNHETRGRLQNNFIEQFPNSNGQPYYTFSVGPVFFVALDGGEDKPDSDIEYCDLADFDNYRTMEADWLRNVVASPEYKNATYRVILLHIPPVGEREWHGLGEIRRKFLPILNKADVDVMLCGHMHQPLYYSPGEEGVNFPVIVNSNVEIMDITADPKSIEVKIKGRDGKVNRTYSYPSK